LNAVALVDLLGRVEDAKKKPQDFQTDVGAQTLEAPSGGGVK